MGLSNVYGRADDEESKAVLRRAIELGMVSPESLANLSQKSLTCLRDVRRSGIRTPITRCPFMGR